jgi:hypothetical protein
VKERPARQVGGISPIRAICKTEQWTRCFEWHRGQNGSLSWFDSVQTCLWTECRECRRSRTTVPRMHPTPVPV